MKVYDIQWDIDLDEAFEKFCELTIEDAAAESGLTCEQYKNMTLLERVEHMKSLWRHCPGKLADFMGLPDEVRVPEELTEEEDISDWLSGTYGYCHTGFCTDSEEIRFFFDMDGTLAHWKAASEEELLQKGFFLNSKPSKKIICAAEKLSQKYAVYVLSAYLPESKYALEEKAAWCDRFVPFLTLPTAKVGGFLAQRSLPSP